MSKKSRSRKKKDRYIKWLKKQATELQARKQSEILRNILSKRIDEIFQSQLISKMPLHLKKLPQAIDTPVVSMNINQLQELDKQELIAIIISYQKLTATCGSIMKADQSFRKYSIEKLERLTIDSSNKI